MVEDVEGRTAMSFPRRNWKEGVRSVEYCGDHCNDCQSFGMLAARGPYSPTAMLTPHLTKQLAGYTWDGGPPASIALLTLTEARPSVRSRINGSLRTEDTARFTQTPSIDFADEGVVAVSAHFTNRFASSVERVINPWVSFGPLAGPGLLINATLR